MLSRRKFLCGLAILAGFPVVAAAPEARASAPGPAPSLAVLSLIGDRLLIVESQMTTGSHLDRNSTEVKEVPGDALNIASALEFERLAKQARRGMAVTPLLMGDRALRELHDAFVSGSRTMRDLVDLVRPSLVVRDFTHLAVLTRTRGDARIRTPDGSVGSGRLEGLGFYVDRWSRLNRVEAGGQEGLGFLAPFAYFRASLVDLETREVLAEESSREAQAYSTLEARETVHPWDTFSAEKKTQVLKAAITRGLEAVVPRLLARLPAPG